MISLKNLLRLQEEEIKNPEFTEFAGKRLDGASKISNDAKQKGGLALLTYHHFIVKLPYYKRAQGGKLDLEQAKREYKQLLDQLVLASKNEELNIEQIDFQELVGKIEVLGELIIKEQKK
jgi:hypothetical protein